MQTVTQSTGTVGGWTIAGLAIPGPYTVTFQPCRPAVADRGRDPRRGRQSQHRLRGRNGRHHRRHDVRVRASSGRVSRTRVHGRRGHGPAGRRGGRHADLRHRHLRGDQCLGARRRVGRYQIGGVVPGTYTLSASRARDHPDQRDGDAGCRAGPRRRHVTDPARRRSPARYLQGRRAGLAVDLFVPRNTRPRAQQTITDAAGNYASPTSMPRGLRRGGPPSSGALGSATLVLRPARPPC